MIIIFAHKNDQNTPHEEGRKLLFDLLNKLYPNSKGFVISKNKNGKPYIPDLPEFHFNISHSGEWTVIAVSDSEIGVDIQLIKPVRNGLAKRFFTRRENLKLDKLNNEEYNAEFTRMWTMKEARTKVTGESLARSLSLFNTVEYDGTTSKMIDGYFVSEIPFPDNRYILALSSASEISNNYYLKIQ